MASRWRAACPNRPFLLLRRTSVTDLAARIDRLESIDAIRQLAAKYSLALDMRDADAWVGLFPEDVKVGKGTSGRAALRTVSSRSCCTVSIILRRAAPEAATRR